MTIFISISINELIHLTYDWAMLNINWPCKLFLRDLVQKNGVLFEICFALRYSLFSLTLCTENVLKYVGVEWF